MAKLLPLPTDLRPLPTSIAELLPSLQRHPDVSSPQLLASDRADQLALRILQEASEFGICGFAPLTKTAPLLVLNDSHGALAVGALELGFSDVRSFQDRLSWSQAATLNVRRSQPHNEHHWQQLTMSELTSLVNTETHLVLVKLPRGLDELRWLAWHGAHNFPNALFLAVGMQKYMTLSQNEVIGTYFNNVLASRGFGKARALVASTPAAKLDEHPPVSEQAHRVESLPSETLDLVGISATFGAARVDPGSRFLIDVLSQNLVLHGQEKVIDLGSGNGTLAVAAALMFPQIQILALDQSASAVAATKLTAQRNSVTHRIQVKQRDGTTGLEQNSADVVLLNPPFHSGHAVDSSIAHKMFTHAAHVLVPGGQLWTVYNSALHYRPVLQQIIGRTKVVATNNKFTVTVSTRTSS